MKLYPFQEDVLKQTDKCTRCAYYLDMGLGKTFIGSTKMLLLHNHINLLICQKSKINDWIEHFQEYYEGFYDVFDLTKKEQSIKFRNRIDTDGDYPYKGHKDIVGIINYDLVFRRDWIHGLEGFTLMLDESSLISNENAKRSRFIMKLNPQNVILLSGTPTAGKYEKLWSQMVLLGWKISKDAFWSSYVNTKWIDVGGGFMHEVVTGYKNVDHLKRKLKEHGVVFLKTQEVMDLPEQVEQQIKLEPTKDYKTFVKNSYLQIEDKELVGDNSLTKMLYARQLCGQYHKGKLNALHDLAESTEDRLIIFYNFTEELKRMQDCLSDLHRPFAVLNGMKKDISAYETESDSITFIQYQAGAMGGNFQKANKIIYYTLPLGKGSCDLWEQSKKRIHRIGQNRPCFYYYLLVKDSIEITNLKSLREGKDLTDALFKENY